MAQSKTSHYEFSSDSLNMMIYAINVKELFPHYFDKLPKNEEIEELIPDIMKN